MVRAVEAEARAPVERPEHAADGRRWLVLGVALTGTFLVIGSVSIVNLAVPSMQRSLGASFGETQFVVAAYTMAILVARYAWPLPLTSTSRLTSKSVKSSRP